MPLTLAELFVHAASHGISIYNFKMNDLTSISTPDGNIGVDRSKLNGTAEELACIAHEIGHCETGSFYNIYTPLDIRQKHENRADRYAYRQLVPKDELDRAVMNGYTEPWELAEYFGVPQPFLEKAVEYYKVVQGCVPTDIL